MPQKDKHKKDHKLKEKKKKSSDSEDSEYEWEPRNKTFVNDQKPVENNLWLSEVNTMDMFLDTFTASKNSSTNKLSKDQDLQKAKTNELNPYWKGGGIGLPECDKGGPVLKSKLTKSNEPWLKKSYIRCLEQSLETRTHIRDLLLQRYDECTVDDMIKAFGKYDRSRKIVKPTGTGFDESRYFNTKESCFMSSNSSKPRWKRSNADSTPSVTESTYSDSAFDTKEKELPSSMHNPIQELIASESDFVERLVTTDDINAMSAKVMRAELGSNSPKLQKLRNNLEKLRDAQRRGMKVRMHTIPKQSVNKTTIGNEPKIIALTHLNDQGAEVPVHIPNLSIDNNGLNKSKHFESHDLSGQRVAYLPADTKDLQISDMIREEHLRSAGDMDLEFSKLAAKASRHVDDEYADAFVKKRTYAEKEAFKAKQDAVAQYKRREFAESSCIVCIERVPKHLIVSTGEKVFLSLPSYRSMVVGHCFLTPYEHVGSFARVDEDTMNELKCFKHQLNLMFGSEPNGSQCIFIETALKPNSARFHTQIECIPVSKDIFISMRAYFKKALSEIGSEWDQNRRIINLKTSGYGAYGSIPPKFGYIAIEFGLQDGGFAKVIDDVQDVPYYFAKEIIAGVLEIDTKLWRNAKSETFEYLRRKVVDFENKWHPFDKWRETHLSNDQSVTDFYIDAEGPALPPNPII